MSQDALTQARWEDRWVRSEPNYDPAADEQLRDSLSLILRYWPDCRGHFLEAGCGSAANALNLAHRGVEVSGVDLSPEAVRVASQAFEARALRGDFRVADVRDLPFPARASISFMPAASSSIFSRRAKRLRRWLVCCGPEAECFSRSLR